MLDCQFYIHASKGPVITTNQLKSIYNSPFKESHSHPIFPKIANNDNDAFFRKKIDKIMFLKGLLSPGCSACVTENY